MWRGQIWQGTCSLDMCSMLIVVPDTTGARRLTQKEAAALLMLASSARSPKVSAVASLAEDRRSAALCSDVAWGRQVVAAGPDAVDAALHLIEALDSESDPVVRRIDELRHARLGEVQSIVDSVYGRLNVDQALVWTMEELGEFAQAARRQESPQRLAEELGQMAAWVYCLGNITGVDVAGALECAVRAEAWRQYTKHGSLKPFRAS